jgi:mevalonate pyrophosphate decarboxylase
MGSNFYARRIPTVEQKEELIEAINNNDFENIKEKVADMYGNITYYGAISGGIIMWNVIKRILNSRRDICNRSMCSGSCCFK